MEGKVKEEVELSVREQSRQMSCEVQEMNVQADHVHMIVQIPPKLSISEYMGRLKGKSAIRVFSVFRDLPGTVSGGITSGRRGIAWGRWAWTPR